MRAIIIGTVAGIAVGAGVAELVSRASHHQIHVYDKPPAREATVGLAPMPGAPVVPPKTQQATAPKPAAPAPAAAPRPAAPAAPPAPATPAQPAAAAPAGPVDLAAGERVFNQCKACHTLKPGQANTLGPNLHGVFGRKSGTLAGFKFSEPMIKAGVVWDEATVEKYVADPKGFVPGNRMAFAGVRNAEQRRNLIGFLKQATQ